MKPSSVKCLIIKEYRQKIMKISANVVPAAEGSPARLADRMRVAGNKKSADLDVKCNVLITYCLT